tara:strand:+ start:2844 stop:3254 length:411 start_codon:yes stop_codon:yes gene_type:complete
MITQIINNIFISDIHTSFEDDIYKKYNINIVINCTTNHKFINLENVKKVRIPLSYDMNQNDNKLLSMNLDNILDYIKNNLLNNVILITCYDGLRISPLIISLFLLKNISNIDKDQINDILKSKNKNIYIDYDLDLF